MKFVAYYRVSKVLGLSLQAQRESVLTYMGEEGGSLCGEYKDVVADLGEMGPKFDVALLHCQRLKATLVISELDPLSRHLQHVTKIVDSRVRLAAAGLPHVNQMLASMKFVVPKSGRRTANVPAQDLLPRANARRVRPGNPKLGDARISSALKRNQQADDFALEHGSAIVRMRANGYSLHDIAELLNENDRPGPRGGEWWPTSVSNLLARYERLSAASS